MAERRRPEPEFGPDTGLERARPAVADADAGRGIVLADAVGTAVFVVVAVAATFAPGPFTLPVIVVSLVLFAAGTVAFLAAYVIAIGRSRTDAIGMGGLFFLADSAPRSVQRQVMALWAVQIVVAIVASSVRIFSGVTFAMLAPMYGIGLAGLWGARHGVFPPRVVRGRVVGAPGDDVAPGVDDDPRG